MGGCVSLQLSCDQALTQACSCLLGDGNYIHMMKANLEALEITMKDLEKRRYDLLRRVSKEEDKGLQPLAQVQEWFSRVASIETQVSDLLKDKSTESKKLFVFGYCSKNCISSCKYGKKVLKKLEEAKELLSKGEFVKLAEKTTPGVEKKHIQATVGLDSMVGKAWNSLMHTERRTLGLYGMGGVGKTTLLASINNKLIEEVNGFDVVIWVVVSKDLQYEGIQAQILRRLGLDKERLKETEEEKAFSIYNILRRKKFVLLLDDLWSEVDLNKIGVPSPTRDNESKIVFTTRSKEICRFMKPDEEMKVDCLSPDESWELFRKTVGEIPLKRHQEIPSLARKIAEKCCGLPLALNVIGKAMSCKEDVHEWRHAIDVLNSSSHKFPGMEENILSILKFSYDGLEDENVKSCFLYCSLFPEDYEIKKAELIEYWISEGFIDGNRDEDGINNQGYAIIGSLVRAHLLMDGEFTMMVKMHDVLREMTLWIGSNLGKGERIWVKSGTQLSRIPEDIDWKVVRRISLMNNQIEEIYSCPNCPNLSTLLLRNNLLVGISGTLFHSMCALVVLDLSENWDLCELPEDISNLSSLLHLNLACTRIRSLPVGLNKLISLDLEFTYRLASIDGICTSISNLQVLKLFHSGLCIDAAIMEEPKLLQHLKVLTATIKDGLVLESIQREERLASCIQGLCLWGISEEVVILDTVALGRLQRLKVYRCTVSEIKIVWESKKREELLCASSQGFKHLYTVHIGYLEDAKDLTWLLLAQDLRYLSVMHSSSIEEIINEEKGTSIINDAPFGKLESLEVRGLLKLKRICSNSLPNLRKFIAEDCPKLPKAATELNDTIV